MDKSRFIAHWIAIWLDVVADAALRTVVVVIVLKLMGVI